MGKSMFFAFLFAASLTLPFSGWSELGLGPPFTRITLAFAAGDMPQAGVNVILVDGAKREHTGVSDDQGRIKFTIQAETATAYLTYWKEKNTVFKKALPYQAGNHYTFRLQLPESGKEKEGAIASGSL